MNSSEFDKYFDTLEITKESTFTDMKNSYIHLRNLYSRDNLSIEDFINRKAHNV